ncbi:Cna B-type domain-containing protein [Butyrivibrio sp. X503]|uniref:Cna B-type domain-containing protein n=1 Tax=Butyrivibrio sp. X503 TaxID=2364878 RepID=UPI000EA94999|nr:Cna B-type domain-containing protein [Butyrivibrio sp. X503]RKM56401.1 Cna B-type domain-containing protein [Butyrivibrio sp. X503]
MNKVKSIFSRILIAVMVFMAAVGAYSVDAHARSAVDLTKTGSLSVTYKFGDDKLFDGVQSHIYKIGSVTEIGEFTLDSDYAGLTSISINSIKDQGQWKQVLEAVMPTAVLQHKPAYTSVSQNGKASFSGIGLGLYLVYTEDLLYDDCRYVFSPFLVTVPQLGDDDEWIYDGAQYIAEATAKCEKYDIDREVQFELHKRWNDSGNENVRPTSISVLIKRNGEEYKRVTLNSGNGWSYSWKDKPGYIWEFEETIEGNNSSYTVSITKNEDSDGLMVVYTMTNTYNDTTPPPPGPPGTPPGGPPSTPPGPPQFPDVLGAIRELPAVLGARRLPQTGQLWWPLPILLIVGIFFIVKGIRKNHKKA